MIRAIDEYRITGVATTLSFCNFVLKHDAFRSGNFDTHFVKAHFKPEYLTGFVEHDSMVAALLASKLTGGPAQSVPKIADLGANVSAWKKNR